MRYMLLICSDPTAPAVEESELPDIDVWVTEMDGRGVRQVGEVLAPSLFGGHRLVVVHGVQEAAAPLVAELLAYARDPDPELTLVLVHHGGKRQEALLTAFRQAGAAVDDCPRVSSAGERVAFVRNEVRRLGGRIAPDAAADGRLGLEVAYPVGQVLEDDPLTGIDIEEDRSRAVEGLLPREVAHRAARQQDPTVRQG